MQEVSIYSLNKYLLNSYVKRTLHCGRLIKESDTDHVCKVFMIYKGN